MFEEEKLPTFVYVETPERDLNTDTPWSAWDEQDIRYAVEHDNSLAETADFLCRKQSEVRDKASEMGLEFKC